MIDDVDDLDVVAPHWPYVQVTDRTPCGPVWAVDMEVEA